MFDIIGVGALNIDLIAPRSVMAHRDKHSLPESLDRFEQNTEKTVAEAELREMIAAFKGDGLRPSFGGSSFLTLSGVSRLGLNLRLGYLGVAGHAKPYMSSSFLDEFDKLRIHRKNVGRTPSPAGLCLSLITQGERSLRVAPLANLEFPQVLQRNRKRIVSYLSKARVVHLTSLLDPESPLILAEILQEVKRISPSTRISLDPGHEWCKYMPAGVEQLLKLADYLIINYGEFCLLANADSEITDLQLARRVLKRCCSTTAAVVVKQYKNVCMYTQVEEGSTEIRETCFQHSPLGEAEIEDATGAGDAFAAGFLAALTSPRLQTELGALLGLSLARTKLGYVGTSGHDRFEPITTALLHSLEKELLEENRSRRFFLSHGRDDDWKILREHLDTWGIDVECFEEASPHGQLVPDIIMQMVRRSGAAVVLMSGEDELSPIVSGRTGDGSGAPLRVARQNVVHELGMLQMWLRADRIFLLAEEGVVVPSNLQGVVMIRYDRGQFGTALRDLRKVLAERQLFSPAKPSQA